ncbi:MAG: hypothetical protein E7480_03760 [Ruminococcaceae bacterium]|nr:hypothetical protein [Oscillospiraceae bacterium]
MQIIKSKETMSSKERVIRTFNHEKTDRVTIGYEANPNIHMRLSKALGIPDGDYEKVFQALGVDYRSVAAPYIGPELFTAPPNRRVDPLEGCIMRWVEHETGGYWDFCDFPLRDADDEVFYNFPVPNPDDFDYDYCLDVVNHYDNQYGIFIGNSGTPDILNSNGRIMGVEDMLCNLALDHEPALYLIKKRADFQLKLMERTLDKCKGKIDFLWLGEDLGTQHTPMISIELYRKHIKPIQKKFVDLAKAYNVFTIIHTCGSSSWAYNDFIELGIDAVDTLQPEATNMSPEYLKKTFGNKLCYRGCISTAGPLAYGTAEETREYCKKTLEIMKKGYGYHFAPTHLIQDNTPTENVIAMYQAAHDFGQYN